MQLIDQYNRRLNYLRISITDRCNLKCIYCTPRQGFTKLRHKDILTYEEILRLSRIAIKLGVNKIRLTGGEPLVRRGIYEFIPKLISLPGLEDVSLTTNGIYLKDNLKKLRSSGIKRLNVSLDTLNRKKYQYITGHDGLRQVLDGLSLAKELGFKPIKINVVVMKGINDDEITDLARLSLVEPYHIRFIEYMPLGASSEVHFSYHVQSSRIKAEIFRPGNLIPVQKSRNDGPAERFRFKGAPGEIGFISPITHNFCHQCNRLRLTANGCLRPCLLSNQEVDIKGPMRAGASEEELSNIFLKAALNKPYAHHVSSLNPIPVTARMSSIGG